MQMQLHKHMQMQMQSSLNCIWGDCFYLLHPEPFPAQKVTVLKHYQAVVAASPHTHAPHPEPRTYSVLPYSINRLVIFPTDHSHTASSVFIYKVFALCPTVGACTEYCAEFSYVHAQCTVHSYEVSNPNLRGPHMPMCEVLTP